jgi:hypothetical protein
MVLNSTGVIKFSDIQTEFGGTNPINLSEYYVNNASGYTAGIAGITSSGNQLNISIFRGKQKIAVPPAVVYTAYTSTKYQDPTGNTNAANYSTKSGYQYIGGASGTNLSRNNVTTFDNSNEYTGTRTPIISDAYRYVLQARAGDQIRIVINGRTFNFNNATKTARTQCYIHHNIYFTDYTMYTFVGSITQSMLTNKYSVATTFDYTIPANLANGNYIICCVQDNDSGNFINLNFYSLQIW